MNDQGHATSHRAPYVDVRTSGSVIAARVTSNAIGGLEAPAIQDHLAEAIDSARPSPRFLVLDLSNVTFMNSVGLGMCIDTRNRANARKATIAFGLTDEIKQLFRLMNLERLFEIIDDEAELASRLRP
jgi:anti-anti-sigma factor